MIVIPTTWESWIARVLAIGRDRGLTVRVEYPGTGLATFIWNGQTRRGVAGAGVHMFQITTPEDFTALWYDEPVSITAQMPEISQARPLTPPLPQIVRPNPTPLPVQLTPGLPSMTPVRETPGGGSISSVGGRRCGGSADAQTSAQQLAIASFDESWNWICRLDAWVANNPILAVGAIAVAYAVAHGKR